jgi:hypothetical protein
VIRSDQPGNRATGATILKALAPSNYQFLKALREPQVLQRIELSLHSCMFFKVQDITWHLAWHAVHELHQVITSPLQLLESRKAKVLLLGSGDSGKSTIIKVRSDLCGSEPVV